MGFLSLQLINGLTMGMIYGMAALGFTMVFKALGYLNFAHADTITIGALLLFTFAVTMNLPFGFAFIAASVCVLIYGFLTEKIIFGRFKRAHPITFMLVSISLSTVVRNVSLLIFGPFHYSVPSPFPAHTFIIAGTTIPMSNVYIFAIALVVLGILQLFFVKTKFGLSLRLASENPKTASLMGIKVARTRAATFAITALLGGVAGMLIAPLFLVSVELGASLALKTFISAVIGGLGNLAGAVIGGLIVGVVESLSAAYISSAYRDVIVFAIGIITLAFFPGGLLRKIISKH